MKVSFDIQVNTPLTKLKVIRRHSIITE